MADPKTIQKRFLGTLLVVAQFLLIALIIVLGATPNSVVRIAVLIAGIGLGVWAIVAMRFHVSIFPEANPVKELTASGPYRQIRHPMYTAVLLTTLSFLNDWQTAVMWIMLLVVLVNKMSYEEHSLAEKFPTYKSYRTKTKRLIPFTW